MCIAGENMQTRFDTIDFPGGKRIPVIKIKPTRKF